MNKIGYGGAANDEEIATDVEKCECPPGYKGLSCEDCAPSWTRFINQNAPANEEIPLGICVPCDCHGGSTCHPETGECQVRSKLGM